MGAGRSLRRGPALVAALALGVVGPVAAAAPAAAHVALDESAPAVRQVVTERVPTRVRLSFDGAVTAGSAVVRVDGPGGVVASRGAPRLDGRTVVQRLGGDLPDGAYVVRWTVTAADGHQVAGAVPFTVSVPAARRAAGQEARTGDGADDGADDDADDDADDGADDGAGDGADDGAGDGAGAGGTDGAAASNPALAAVLVTALGFALLAGLRRLRSAFR